MLCGSGGTQPSRWPRLRGFAFLFASLFILCGCSLAGLSGRPGDPPQTAARDPQVTGSISIYAVTEDEQHLRDLARGLIESPLEDERGMPTIGEEGEGRYIAYLVDGPFRSAAARYSRLIDDTRNDITRLEPFFLAARRVADLDVKRDRSLPHVSGLTQEDALNAKRRVRENMMLIAEVHRVMSDRVRTYRTALERLVIALPSPMAVEAERQRHELERRLAAVRVFDTTPRTTAVSK